MTVYRNGSFTFEYTTPPLYDGEDPDYVGTVVHVTVDNQPDDWYPPLEESIFGHIRLVINRLVFRFELPARPRPAVEFFALIEWLPTEASPKLLVSVLDVVRLYRMIHKCQWSDITSDEREVKSMMDKYGDVVRGFLEQSREEWAEPDFRLDPFAAFIDNLFDNIGRENR